MHIIHLNITFQKSLYALCLIDLSMINHGKIFNEKLTKHVPLWYRLVLTSFFLTFRGKCSSFKMLKGYMVRQRLGTPGL